MKNIYILLLLLVAGAANAQNKNPNMDVSMGYNNGLYFSWDIYSNADRGYDFLGFAFGSDLKGHGEDYTGVVGQFEFYEDVVQELDGYYHLSLTGGKKIAKNLYLKGALGYQQNLLVQNRRDRFTILGYNGRYYTSFRDGAELYYQGGIKYLYKPKYTIFTGEVFYSTQGVGVGIGIGL